MNAEHTDLEKLLADILNDDVPLPMAAHQEINKHKGQTGTAIIANPDAFDVASGIEASGEMALADIFTDTEKRTTPAPSQIKMPVFVASDLAATMDIRNYAVLVTLNTARWHAKVKDRQASRDAATMNNANEHAFETRKRLLVGADDQLKSIHKAIDNARAAHYEMTLPWSTTGMEDKGRRTGGRLLPNTLFFDYTKAMAEHKNTMLAALNQFVPLYPSLIEVSRLKLGKRFDPAEYPNPSSIGAHFGLSFDFQPIPQGNDFKGLPQVQLEALAKKINDNTETMTQNAMQDVWMRLREGVAHLAERLSSPDKLFHNTTVTNLRDVVSLMGHLNILNDARVEKFRKLVSVMLCTHEPQVLRDNLKTRALVAQQAVEILKRMDT